MPDVLTIAALRNTPLRVFTLTGISAGNESASPAPARTPPSAPKRRPPPRPLPWSGTRSPFGTGRPTPAARPAQEPTAELDRSPPLSRLQRVVVRRPGPAKRCRKEGRTGIPAWGRTFSVCDEKFYRHDNAGHDMAEGSHCETLKSTAGPPQWHFPGGMPHSGAGRPFSGRHDEYLRL